MFWTPKTPLVMQSSPLLLLRSKTASLIQSLRMLSSSSSLTNPNPNFSMRTPTSEIPTLFPFLKISKTATSISKLYSNVQNNGISLISCASMSEMGNPEADLDKSNSNSNSNSLVVVSFYKFADFPDHADMRKPLKELCEDVRVSGGIILASEGINGSICGTKESVERVLEYIQSDKRLNGLRQIESPVSPEEEAIHHGHTSGSPLAAGEDAPFRWDHVRVKVKKEIVSLGMPTVSPIEKVGQYVSPRDWNALISDPDTVVVDVRNMYETRIGKFKGAVNPCTKTFREFPSWVDDRFQLAESDGQQSNDSNKSMEQESKVHEPKIPPRVAMYCTGGIRCEKASSFLLSKGFKEVYHLEGGILKYLEEVPKTDSLWEGECFVFDKRVSVEHGLAQGTFKLCYGCKQPVSDADMESPLWEYGVTCPYCFSAKSEEEKERARARQMQFETWGVIGGPDKGHRPLTTSLQAGDMEKKLSYLSTSV